MKPQANHNIKICAKTPDSFHRLPNTKPNKYSPNNKTIKKGYEYIKIKDGQYGFGLHFLLVFQIPIPGIRLHRRRSISIPVRHFYKFQ